MLTNIYTSTLVKEANIILIYRNLCNQTLKKKKNCKKNAFLIQNLIYFVSSSNTSKVRFRLRLGCYVLFGFSVSLSLTFPLFTIHLIPFRYTFFPKIKIKQKTNIHFLFCFKLLKPLP